MEIDATFQGFVFLRLLRIIFNWKNKLVVFSVDGNSWYFLQQIYKSKDSFFDGVFYRLRNIPQSEFVFYFNTNFYNDTCKYLIRRKVGFLGSKVYSVMFKVISNSIYKNQMCLCPLIVTRIFIIKYCKYCKYLIERKKSIASIDSGISRFLKLFLKIEIYALV